MSKDFSITDQRSVDLVTQALPGRPATSSNAPANKDAAQEEARAIQSQTLAERRARQDAVRGR